MVAFARQPDAGRRIRRGVDGAGAGTPTYAYQVHQGDHALLEFTDADGLGGTLQPHVLAHRYLYGAAVDEILAVENDVADTVLFGLADHEGTIRDVVDASGVAVNHLKLDSFANPRDGTAPIADFLFGQAGRPWDPDGEWWDMRARIYDPKAARFLQEDPSGLTADSNPYRYCGNNPINNIDPSGLCWTGFSGLGAWSPNSSPVSSYGSSLGSVTSGLWGAITGVASSVWNATVGAYNAPATPALTAYPYTTAYNSRSGTPGLDSMIRSAVPLSAAASPQWGIARRQVDALADVAIPEPKLNTPPASTSYTLGDYATFTGEGLHGFFVTGPWNIGVGFKDMGKEVGLQAYDLGTGAIELGGYAAGQDWRFNYQSNLGQAAVQEDFSYGTHALRTGGAVVTIGNSEHVITGYELWNGDISMDQASQRFGPNGILQVVALRGIAKQGGGFMNKPIPGTPEIPGMRFLLPKPGGTPATPVEPSPPTGQRPLVQSPGKISGNPANKLIDTGIPRNSGGWRQRWVRMSDEDYQAHWQARGNRLDELYAQTREMPSAEARAYHFAKMGEWLRDWYSRFLQERKY